MPHIFSDFSGNCRYSPSVLNWALRPSWLFSLVIDVGHVKVNMRIQQDGNFATQAGIL